MSEITKNGDTDKTQHDNTDTHGSPKPGARQSRGRTCQVCGDKALGYNFNAVTCESCKAFFRRNALTKKEFTCPFNQNCEITVVTRRFCQKCRLARCFEIGMKKEYIMSEVEKVEKRKKIEMNRAKRRVSTLTSNHSNDNGSSDDVASTSGSTNVKRIKREHDFMQNDDESWSNMDDGSSFTAETPKISGEYSVHSPAEYSSPPTPSIYVTHFNASNAMTQDNEIIASNTITSLNLTPSEIVERIISVPEQSSQIINQLMPTQEDAMRVMSAIIKSPTDALQLINHFISQPGDALTIISKIMNSALDALSVFIQFMSSPTDALQIINKIMSSPNEVLQFTQQLMNSPQDALDIMTKFMNEPAEALKMINRMINNEETHTNDINESNSEEVKLRKKVEGNLIKSIINTNTIEAAPALECNSTQTFNPFNSYSHLSYASTSSQCAEQLSVPPNGIPQISNHTQTSKLTPSSSSSTTNNINNTNNHMNNTSDSSKYSDILEEISNKSIQPNSIESILCEAIKLEYDCFSLMSQNNSNNRELNDSERAKLNELIVANKALYMPVDEDWANLISDSARQKIPHSQEEMSNIKADVLKQAKGNVYQEHEKFIQTFEKKWRQDENIILIMCAITLFTHDRARTVHSDVIKLEQNSYYYLLRRYLESVYPGCEAKSTFLKLMQKINELHKLNEEIINVYLDVNPSQVEPLLREIFDLKVNLS
uniref:CSON000745 protein n=1 Tax=Culicoides sonorensis TaxID=179676 RepID=A0A336K580_CULSO